ncbi:MAG: cytochrome c [Planctomycetes bacterium]|nr:cytochrome c [Planctomycetota bacterium]
MSGFENKYLEIFERFQPKYSPKMMVAAIAVPLLLAFIIPLALVAIPFNEFWNGMAVQRKGKAQMQHGWVNGEALNVERKAVAGTIPRGFIPHPEELQANDQPAIEKAGKMLMNPLALNKENLLLGQERYNVFCVVCHGERGLSDGGVVGSDRYPAPTSIHDPVVRNYPDGSIYQIITRGKGKMIGYADKLNEKERWAVIHYVRALQRAENPQPGDLK